MTLSSRCSQMITWSQQLRTWITLDPPEPESPTTGTFSQKDSRHVRENYCFVFTQTGRSHWQLDMRHKFIKEFSPQSCLKDILMWELLQICSLAQNLRKYGGVDPGKTCLACRRQNPLPTNQALPKVACHVPNVWGLHSGKQR